MAEMLIPIPSAIFRGDFQLQSKISKTFFSRIEFYSTLVETFLYLTFFLEFINIYLKIVIYTIT